MRGADFGGAPEGTPELYFTDPEGILIQVQDARYCGGNENLVKYDRNTGDRIRVGVLKRNGGLQAVDKSGQTQLLLHRECRKSSNGRA